MFARGSIPWFIAHDIKLSWRSMFQRGKGPRKRRASVPAPLVIGILLVLAALLLGVPLARWLQDATFAAVPIVAFLIDAVLLLVFTLMLSQTLVGAVDAFYDRGDLDLLLSSPIPPTRILIMRAVAMALQPMLLFGGVALPFVVPLAFYGHPEMLGVFVIVASLAFLSTAVGLAIAIGLFSAIGPRRTRTVAQVMAALVGAAFVLIAQVPALTGFGDDDQTTAGWLAGLMNAEDFPALATWPARAFLGEPLPLLTAALFATTVFTVVSLWVGRRFARDAAAASGADTIRTRKGREEARFGGSMMRATIIKELRLLCRDPGLLSQVLLRVFYLVPLAIVILTDTGESALLTPAIIAGGMSLLAGQLAGSVAWIALSAEDAPELLASSPHRMRDYWRAKMITALMVPGVLLVPVALLYAVFFDPLYAAIGIAAATASAWSAAMINLWLQKPTKRSEFRRSWASTLAANALELIASLAFAAFAGLAVAGLGIAWIPLTIAVAVIVLARRSEEAVLERITGAA